MRVAHCLVHLLSSGLGWGLGLSSSVGRKPEPREGVGARGPPGGGGVSQDSPRVWQGRDFGAYGQNKAQHFWFPSTPCKAARSTHDLAKAWGTRRRGGGGGGGASGLEDRALPVEA